MYPVRLEIKENLGDTIKFIKEILRLIPNKGIGYGAIYGYNKNILPAVVFIILVD